MEGILLLNNKVGALMEQKSKSSAEDAKGLML